MRKPQFTLACDVDQVVADLYPEWLRRYNLEYGDSLQPSDIKGWGIDTFVKPECGKSIFKYLQDKTLYDNVKPISGALECIQLLRENDIRVAFVTSSNSYMAGRKLHWLADHKFLTLFQGHSSYDFVECMDKSLIRADALIDDYWGNLEKFVGEKILMNEHHNQEMLLRDGYYRAFGWPDAASHILHLKVGIPNQQRTPLQARLLDGK